jgi:hypothetical protein
VARKLHARPSLKGDFLLDLDLTAAYAAAALATAALICDEAAGFQAARADGPVLAGGEHPGLPGPPEPARPPVDPAARHSERPMAGGGRRQG